MKSMIFCVEVLGSLVEVHHVLQEDTTSIFRVKKLNFTYQVPVIHYLLSSDQKLNTNFTFPLCSCLYIQKNTLTRVSYLLPHKVFGCMLHFTSITDVSEVSMAAMFVLIKL